MSETAYNVEDEGAAAPAETPEPAAAAEAPPPAQAAPEPQEPEEEGVEVGGQKLVPLAALHAAREEAKALKQKASQVDQVLGWYQQNRPYVEFLQNNPDLLKPRQAQPEPVKALPPEQDDALVQLARTLDLYTPEGQPDAKRASVIRNLVKSEAQSIAQEAVKPLHEQSVQERAQTNLRDAMNASLPDGRKPDPQVLQHIWRSTDPKVLATPEGAAAAVMMAVGLGSFVQPPAPPQAQPVLSVPVVTEPSGGRNVNRAPVSEFEQRIMQVRGITPQKYQEYTRHFKSGDANVLED